ncbi:hypothetical protein PUN28_011266 [Cardiocondyla obscurior]|uniref:Uncharacterized protein n=1 Tax=Cardiocondyla obscurior TaxID=286306 RepID=A0AAW2FKJ8_9HYME
MKALERHLVVHVFLYIAVVVAVAVAVAVFVFVVVLVVFLALISLIVVAIVIAVISIAVAGTVADVPSMMVSFARQRVTMTTITKRAEQDGTAVERLARGRTVGFAFQYIKYALFRFNHSR